MEYKNVALPVKDVQDRTVMGFAAVFGNIDSGGDRIFKGFFKKTLNENLKRVRHLWMHDPMQPPTAAIKELKEVGRDELPEETKEAFPEATGGLLVAREYLRTPRGDEILEGIKSGAIAEMSFGYEAVKFDFEEVESPEGKLRVRNLREGRLYDTSDVNWGMNAATSAAKEAGLFQLYELTAAIEACRDLEDSGVLSSRKQKRLSEALAMLNEILTAAEPPEDEEKSKALTEQVLRRLAIYERDPILNSVR